MNKICIIEKQVPKVYTKKKTIPIFKKWDTILMLKSGTTHQKFPQNKICLRDTNNRNVQSRKFKNKTIS